jgi:Uma2 family endonuclease
MIATAPVKPQLTLEQFLALPETKPYSEYLDGKIEQKPMPQGEHSTLQIRLGTTINQIALPQKLAHAFTELRCNIEGRSFVPDISVFTWERISKTATGRIANRIDTYPDWVIEILSPEQSANKVIKKIMACLQAGTQLAWLVDPEDESVLIFRSQQFPEMKSEGDRLPVLEQLSALDLSVADLFSWLSLD